MRRDCLTVCTTSLYSYFAAGLSGHYTRDTETFTIYTTNLSKKTKIITSIFLSYPKRGGSSGKGGLIGAEPSFLSLDSCMIGYVYDF